MQPSQDFAKLLGLYKTELLDDVMPWWMEHAIDREDGGILHDLAPDGTMRSGDKSMWSQGRALWTFSALYNRIGQRHEWLEVANHLCEFVLRIGRENEWVWPQRLHRDGSVKEGPRQIYADGFAIMGLTEYARATGVAEAIQAALATYETVQERMGVLGTHLAVPETIADIGKCQGISMIFSTVFHELGKLLDDAEILKAGHDHAAQILDQFRRPDRQLLLEYLALDGSELDAPEGRHCNPGHAIEAMWFVTHLFRDRGEKNRMDQAVECIRWHIEKCWDPDFGGMFGELEADGSVPEPDAAKAFWPHGEALYALLLAYEHCGEQWCLDWYDRVHEWTFAHFPVREHGEWREMVERDGSIPQQPGSMHTCFHLPRTLMMCVDVLQRLAGA